MSYFVITLSYGMYNNTLCISWCCCYRIKCTCIVLVSGITANLLFWSNVYIYICCFVLFL